MNERKNDSKKKYRLSSRQRSLQTLQTLTITKMGDKDLKSAEEWIYGKIETPEKEHLLNLQHKKIYERYQKNDINPSKIFILLF